MIDQYTPPTSAVPPLQSNPASVYDEVDAVTLTPEQLALSGAITQTQVDLAEDSAQTLLDMQAVMAAEAADKN